MNKSVLLTDCMPNYHELCEWHVQCSSSVCLAHPTLFSW